MSERDEIRREGLFEGGDTTVTVTLDDDTTIECVVITIFTVGEDKDYIALMPTEDNVSETGEVYLYRYTETEDGQPDLTNIESDEEYELVVDAFDELLDEQEFSELLENDPEDEE